ncbi:hypothetical protein Hanom_Chr16g01516031 [Helianthus anomalus]
MFFTLQIQFNGGGEWFHRLGGCRQPHGEVERGCFTGGEVPKRGEERGRLGPINDFFFFFFFFKKKKPIHLKGEWRHQMGVLGEFKREVDVTHGDWFGVREGTHLLGEHPLHPKVFFI